MSSKQKYIRQHLKKVLNALCADIIARLYRGLVPDHGDFGKL